MLVTGGGSTVDGVDGVELLQAETTATTKMAAPQRSQCTDARIIGPQTILERRGGVVCSRGDGMLAVWPTKEKPSREKLLVWFVGARGVAWHRIIYSPAELKIPRPKGNAMLTKILVVYSTVLTTLLAAFALVGYAAPQVQQFDEIDVHRLNVREPDGTLRMVISNHARLPGVVVRGKENPPVDRPYAGMLFYNDEGTENGGLVFGGHRNVNGEVVDSGVSLSFDRYGSTSQFVQLAGVDDSTNHIVGLTLSETDATGNRRRVSIGHDKEGVASVSLMDRNGRKRIVLQVTPDGTPDISFLDADGKVVNQIGPTRSK